MSDEKPTVDGWVKDGTPTEEPVTVETPAEPKEPEVPAPEPTPEPEPAAAEKVEEVPAEPAQFVGKLGEEEYKVPQEFLVPLKRGDEVEWARIDELQKRGMMEKDYRAKTQELADQRRELEQQLVDAKQLAARHKAREDILMGREKRVNELTSNPEGLERYQEHLEQYRNNPLYRDAIDRSLEAEFAVSDQQLSQEAAYAEAVQKAADMATGWISELSADERFKGVDPVRVREEYAQQLQAGSAPLDRAEVEKIFTREAAYRTSIVEDSPLRRELEELKAQVAKQAEAQQASAHNSTVQHAIERAQSPNVTPSGTPASPTTTSKPKPFGPKEIDERIRTWSSVR